jgi:hypothetical protein
MVLQVVVMGVLDAATVLVVVQLDVLDVVHAVDQLQVVVHKILMESEILEELVVDVAAA